MSNLRLAFVIDAVDRATQTVTRINASIDRMQQPALRARAALNGLLQASRFERVRTAMGELSERAQGVASWGRSMAGAGLAVSAAATAAGYSLKATINEVDTMLDQAKKLGVPIEMYQRLGFAAQLNGSNQMEMGQALQFLSQNMVEAINGGKEMQLWFARVGITMAHLKKMNAVQVFEAIADKFAKVGDAGQNAEKKIAVMRAMMGRGGAELKQVLDLGSAGLKKFYTEADKLGGVVGKGAAEAMGDFNDEWDRMEFAVKGGARAVASAALPALNELVKRVTLWAVANRDLKATRVAEFVDGFLSRLPAIATSLGQIGGALATVIALADQFAQAVGGWQVVIGAIAAIIVGKGVYALGMLTYALYGVAAAFMATPFGWFAAGVAGVVALAAVVYAKWEPIKRFFSDLWAGIISGINSVDRFIPAWARVPDVGPDGRAIRPGPAAVSAVAAAPVASAVSPRGAPYRAEVGGTLKIEFDDQGKPRVRELRKAPGGLLDFDVYSGNVMAGS